MDIKLVNKEDYDKIYTFVEEAFKTAEVSDGTEQDFVLELRKTAITCRNWNLPLMIKIFLSGI